MRFSETAWKCFRNLEPRRQQWRPGLNVFLGPNGSGKTNILESLNILSGWSVFPAPGGRISSTIAWNSTEKRVLLSASASGERDVEVAAQIGERLSLRVSNERATYSELRSLLPSLSFLPGDVNILDGSPSVRRFFLDKLCVLCSPLYARRLSEYRQLVRHRSVLLRSISYKREAFTLLRASVDPISQLGGWIRLVREKAVALLSEKLSDSLVSGDILPFSLGVAMELKNSGINSVNKADIGVEGYVEDLKLALDANFERERHAGIVLSGPHRDDLMFSCLSRPASAALSRGQKKRVVVAVILAAGRLIEAKLRVKPILVLDDVAAELDADGRSLMGQALVRTGWQVFATGASSENPFKTDECAVWHIRDGKIMNEKMEG